MRLREKAAQHPGLYGFRLEAEIGRFLMERGVKLPQRGFVAFPENDGHKRYGLCRAGRLFGFALFRKKRVQQRENAVGLVLVGQVNGKVHAGVSTVVELFREVGFIRDIRSVQEFRERFAERHRRIVAFAKRAQRRNHLLAVKPETARAPIEKRLGFPRRYAGIDFVPEPDAEHFVGGMPGVKREDAVQRFEISGEKGDGFFPAFCGEDDFCAVGCAAQTVFGAETEEPAFQVPVDKVGTEGVIFFREDRRDWAVVLDFDQVVYVKTEIGVVRGSGDVVLAVDDKRIVIGFG